MAENKIVDPVPEPLILTLPFDNFVSLARTRDCLGFKHARSLLFRRVLCTTHMYTHTCECMADDNDTRVLVCERETKEMHVEVHPRGRDGIKSNTVVTNPSQVRQLSFGQW